MIVGIPIALANGERLFMAVNSLQGPMDAAGQVATLLQRFGEGARMTASHGTSTCVSTRAVGRWPKLEGRHLKLRVVNSRPFHLEAADQSLPCSVAAVDARV